MDSDNPTTLDSERMDARKKRRFAVIYLGIVALVILSFFSFTSSCDKEGCGFVAGYILAFGVLPVVGFFLGAAILAFLRSFKRIQENKFATFRVPPEFFIGLMLLGMNPLSYSGKYPTSISEFQTYFYVGNIALPLLFYGGVVLVVLGILRGVYRFVK